MQIPTGEMDERCQDQRHLRGNRTDQHADHRPADPGVLQQATEVDRLLFILSYAAKYAPFPLMSFFHVDGEFSTEKFIYKYKQKKVHSLKGAGSKDAD
jgi:hypothetical protein